MNLPRWRGSKNGSEQEIRAVDARLSTTFEADSVRSAGESVQPGRAKVFATACAAIRRAEEKNLAGESLQYQTPMQKEELHLDMVYTPYIKEKSSTPG